MCRLKLVRIASSISGHGNGEGLIAQTHFAWGTPRRVALRCNLCSDSGKRHALGRLSPETDCTCSTRNQEICSLGVEPDSRWQRTLIRAGTLLGAMRSLSPAYLVRVGCLFLKAIQYPFLPFFPLLLSSFLQNLVRNQLPKPSSRCTLISAPWGPCSNVTGGIGEWGLLKGVSKRDAD